MSTILSGPAQVYVYDITMVMKLLQPALSDPATNHAVSVLGRDAVIDVFLEMTIHDFEVVSVWDHRPGQYPATLTNLFKQQPAAISELYQLLWLPPECAGSMAMFRRHRNTLWLIVFDPVRVRPFTKPKRTERIFH